MLIYVTIIALCAYTYILFKLCLHTNMVSVLASLIDVYRSNPDLPLILILSVYTDFVTLQIWQNTDFLP